MHKEYLSLNDEEAYNHIINMNYMMLTRHM